MSDETTTTTPDPAMTNPVTPPIISTTTSTQPPQVFTPVDVLTDPVARSLAAMADADRNAQRNKSYESRHKGLDRMTAIVAVHYQSNGKRYSADTRYHTVLPVGKQQPDAYTMTVEEGSWQPVIVDHRRFKQLGALLIINETPKILHRVPSPDEEAAERAKIVLWATTPIPKAEPGTGPLYPGAGVIRPRGPFFSEVTDSFTLFLRAMDGAGPLDVSINQLPGG